jgi:hypothetical protein
MKMPVDLTRQACNNILQSMFMLGGFTVFWTVFMFWGFGFGVLPFVVAVVLIACAVAIFIAASKMKPVISKAEKRAVDSKDKKASKNWNVIFIIQGTAVGIVCGVLSFVGAYTYIPAAVALIVGLHYFPLSILYHTKIQTVVAIPVVIVSVLCIVMQAVGMLGVETIGIVSLCVALSTVMLGFYMHSLLKSQKILAARHSS